MGDTCGIAIKWMTEDNATTQTQLTKAGVLRLIIEALKKFQEPPVFNHWAYPVVPTCVGALLNLARNNTMNQDAMLMLGVYETLGVSLQLFDVSYERQKLWTTPWSSSFPISGLTELQRLLASRRESNSSMGVGQ